MALPEAGDEFYEIRGDRPPDGHIGGFGVWDPENKLGLTNKQPVFTDQQVASMSEANQLVSDAFTIWVSGEYPQAKNIRDVINILNGTFVELKVPDP